MRAIILIAALVAGGAQAKDTVLFQSGPISVERHQDDFWDEQVNCSLWIGKRTNDRTTLEIFSIGHKTRLFMSIKDRDIKASYRNYRVDKLRTHGNQQGFWYLDDRDQINELANGKNLRILISGTAHTEYFGQEHLAKFSLKGIDKALKAFNKCDKALIEAESKKDAERKK